MNVILEHVIYTISNSKTKYLFISLYWIYFLRNPIAMNKQMEVNKYRDLKKVNNLINFVVFYNFFRANIDNSDRLHLNYSVHVLCYRSLFNFSFYLI